MSERYHSLPLGTLFMVEDTTGWHSYEHFVFELKAQDTVAVVGTARYSSRGDNPGLGKDFLLRLDHFRVLPISQDIARAIGLSFRQGD